MSSMINPSVVDMDVDGPPVNGSSGGTLKRCSSAPMINESNTIMTTATPSTSSQSREQQGFNAFGAQTRARRFSASFSPGSPISNLRLSRINQLRQEEQADVSNLRELAHEREVHHTMQMSQSWEDLSLMTESQGEKPCKTGPLHVNLPPYSMHMNNCNSPSPTRLSSPSFQSPTRASRTFIRRSASPVFRPSPLLGVKRKLDSDDKLLDFNHISPRAKRLHSYSAVERGGLLTTTTSSLPGSLSSVGTPESLSSADSPGNNYNFRNVDSPSPNMNMPPEPMMVSTSKNDHEMNESPS